MPSLGNHVDAIFLPESVNTSTTLRINGGDLHLDDGKKALFGQSDDLQIYHDGSNSYIEDDGTGQLRILSNKTLIKNAANTVTLADFATANNDVTLFEGGSARLQTTSTGVTVTGTVISDGLSLGDNEVANFGENNDLQIYHESTYNNSVIKETGSGNLLLGGRSIDFRDAGLGETYALFKNTGTNTSVELYYDNSKKLETTTTGVTVTGTALATALSTGAAGTGINISTNTISGPATLTIDPAAIGDDTGNVEIKGNLTVQGTTTTINSTTVDLDHLSLGDNEIANFGDSNDLQIYHDGINSYVQDAGTGNLILSGTRVNLLNPAANETMVSAQADGPVELYYDNVKKFETTSTGSKISGTLHIFENQATLLKLERDGIANAGIRYENDTSQMFAGLSTNAEFFGIGASENIGSSATQLVVMRATGNVGIGTTSPSSKLAVNGTGTVASFGNLASGSVDQIDILATANYPTIQCPSSLDTLQIASLGNVQIAIDSNNNSTQHFRIVSGGKDAGGSELFKIDESGNFKVFQAVSAWASSTYHPVLMWDFKSGVGDMMYMASGGNSAIADQMALVISDNHGFKVGKSGWDGTDTDISSTNEFFRITTAGDVGIGTSNPGSTLHLYSSDPRLTITDSDQPSRATQLRNTNGNTYLNQLSSGNMIFGVPDEAMRIDSSGRLLVSTSTARTNIKFDTTSVTPIYQIESTGSSAALSITRNVSNANAATIYIAKTRGTSNGANTIVFNNDNLGSLSFNGADGANLINAARIDCEVDGTPGTNDMPGRLVFLTTADGASSPTERLRIDSTGKVGIGTNNPQEKLDVGGTILTKTIVYTTNQDQPYLIAGSTSYTGANTNWGTYGFQHRFKSNSSGTARVTIDTFSKEVFCVNNNGNVGIGTDDPASTLDIVSTGGVIGLTSTTQTNSARINIKGGTSSYAGINFGDSDALTIGYARYYNSDDSLRIQTNGSEKVRIESNGNVGIGTDDPQGNLHISSGTSGDCTLILQSDTDNNAEGDNSFIIFKQDGSIEQSAVWNGNADGSNDNSLNLSNSTTANGGIRFFTGSADNNWDQADERMRIAPDGNVGIGTIDPQSTLHVKGGIQLDGSSTAFNNNFSRIYQNSSSTIDYGLQLRHYQGDTTDVDASITIGGNGSTRKNNIAFYRSNGSGGSNESMRIDENGNVGIGTATPAYKLEVEGDIKVGELGTLWFSDASGSVEKIVGTGGNLDIYSDAKVSFFESDNNVRKFTVDVNNGQLDLGNNLDTTTAQVHFDYHDTSYINGSLFGLGTTSPAANLQVEYGTGTHASTTIRIGTTNDLNIDKIYSLGWGDPATTQMGMGPYSTARSVFGSRHGLGIHVKSTDEFSVRSSGWDKLFGVEGDTGRGYFKGNVGIGTIDPQEKLHVEGNMRLNGSVIGGVLTAVVADDSYVDVTPSILGGHFVITPFSTYPNFPQPVGSGMMYYDVGNSRILATVVDTEVQRAGGTAKLINGGTSTSTTATDFTDDAITVTTPSGGTLRIFNRAGSNRQFKLVFL